MFILIYYVGRALLDFGRAARGVNRRRRPPKYRSASFWTSAFVNYTSPPGCSGCSMARAFIAASSPLTATRVHLPI